MSFLGIGKSIHPMRTPVAPASSPHRLDELPAGYSLAGCAPALPASASPTASDYALHSSRRSIVFHRTVNSVLTVCLITGGRCNPVSVDKALDGVDKLYLLNAVVPDELTQGLIAYDLAKKRKIQHIVYHSVFRVDHFKDVPHFASKLAIESALREFDLPFTIIRPNYFFQNDETMKDPLTKAGIYPVPLGSAGISAVDVRDIAEASAIALTSNGHEGKTYNLNGPDVLSGPHVAQIWTRLLGKEIRYPGEDMDSFEGQMRQKAPSWSAFDIRMMFQGYLERGFVAEAGDIETLTNLLGHPPRRYQDFARETAASWEKQKW